MAMSLKSRSKRYLIIWVMIPRASKLFESRIKELEEKIELKQIMEAKYRSAFMKTAWNDLARLCPNTNNNICS